MGAATASRNTDMNAITAMQGATSAGAALLGKGAAKSGAHGAGTANANAANRITQGAGIRVIVKAAAVIDLLAESNNPVSLTDLSGELGIAKSTLHGILATLSSIGYVSKDPDSGDYRLGLRLFELGNTISHKLDERRIAKPYMQVLSEKTGETAHLAILDDGEVLYINKQESNSSIRIITESGLKLPVHCSGLGKVLLAGMPDEEILALLAKKGMAKYTETTITSTDVFMKEIERVRRQGWASDKQEFMIGLKCVAAPIHNINGKVICAISISGPISRMSGDLLEAKRAHLMKAAKGISKKLGYTGGTK
ncbi:MAG: IclR family transcriptional regulator [Clostridiales Family XIII bacterium]|jgi:DNA-binding IclR family transcriptional regulator|nr:IclR family transcriptional regulator [Clostridiales Family XIII bacterium]